MKRIAKLLCIITLITMLIGVFTGCNEIGLSSRRGSGYYDDYNDVYTVRIEVNVKHNILFSDYDVNVLVDGEFLGTLSDKETDVYTVYLEYGRHKVRFEKADDTTLNTSVTINVTGNDYYSYTLKRHNKLNGGIKVTTD